MKDRLCRDCKQEFTPHRPMQPRCIPCAIIKGRDKTRKDAARVEREERKATRIKLDALKTRSEWAREAQAAFNGYIRHRDQEQPCISCGITVAKWDAGHYRSRAAAPELAYSELNCHKQCAQCNTFKAGNVVEYRINLIKRIGIANVEWLEGTHPPKKYTIDQLKEIKATYKAKLKAAKDCE